MPPDSVSLPPLPLTEVVACGLAIDAILTRAAEQLVVAARVRIGRLVAIDEVAVIAADHGVVVA